MANALSDNEKVQATSKLSIWAKQKAKAMKVKLGRQWWKMKKKIPQLSIKPPKRQTLFWVPNDTNSKRKTNANSRTNDKHDYIQCKSSKLYFQHPGTREWSSRSGRTGEGIKNIWISRNLDGTIGQTCWEISKREGKIKVTTQRLKRIWGPAGIMTAVISLKTLEKFLRDLSKVIRSRNSINNNAYLS